VNTRQAGAWFRKLVTTIRKAEYIAAFRRSGEFCDGRKSCDKSAQKVNEETEKSELKNESNGERKDEWEAIHSCVQEAGKIGSNWKLTLAYDGTDFYGWQVQPDRVTVQGTLADAIERVTGERLLPQGSGRTDAGVHARGQVASFWLEAAIPAENLQRALNRKLPEAVRVVRAETASAEFHARHFAKAKTYEYRIYRGEICPPWEARYAWALNWPLDVGKMREASRLVVGRHDFTSFAASDPDLAARSLVGEGCEDAGGAGNVRTVFESEWREEGELVIYRVRGDGFLHHMVRNLVGTFVDLGRGAIEAGKVTEILQARSRGKAGATAPARALFLDSVEY